MENTGLNLEGPWRMKCKYARKSHSAALPSDWPRMRRVIAGALADYPEARSAITAAIRKFASETRDECVE